MGSSRIHCQEEFERDIGDIDLHGEFAFAVRWFYDNYSTSKHHWLLHSIPIALQAKKIGEIGFGRSTIILAYAAKQLDTKHIVCDRYDYRKYVKDLPVTYIKGYSDDFYNSKEVKDAGMDFLFLDYLSSRKSTALYCYKELKKAFKLMKQNGFIAVHDTWGDKYNVKYAIRNLKKKYAKEAEVITFPYGFGLTLIRRVGPSPHGTLMPKSIKKKDTGKA